MAKLIEELLQQREGSSIDFKTDDSSPKKIVKDFVAFGNTAGGMILIGVDDERKVVGLDDAQEVEEAIANAIYNSTEPQQAPVISVITHEDKEVVVVKAQYFQGAEPLALKEGEKKRTVFERVGSNSMPVKDRDRLEQMRRERRGRDGFDQLPATASTIDDLDMNAIKEAFAAQGITVDETKLESFDLAVRQNDELVPTHAGILLFGKNPNAFLPDAYFRGIRYAGETKSGDVLDSVDWRGLSLLRALEDIESFIARNTGTAQTIPGRRRRNVPHYDPTLLREILHNAIAHADYSRTGQHLNISIFSDHLMIDSPGKLPAGMIVEYLKQGVSKVRNTALMNVLHVLGYVEKYGTVYAKAEAAQEAGYPIPEWSEPGPILRVTMFPHPIAAPPPKSKGAGKRRNREKEIYEHLRRYGQKTAAALADEIELSARQTRSYLRSLEKDGRVRAIGDGPHDPNRAYRITGTTDG
jgi:predicted HTH transcriptional regulator